MSAENPERRLTDAVVVYPVGELLAGIRDDMGKGFARVEKGLEAKADKSDVARLNGRLDEHQKQITELRQRQDRDDEQTRTRQEIKTQRRDWHRWLYPTLAAVGLTVITILQTAGVFR